MPKKPRQPTLSTVYVSPTGSDSNSGSIDNPLRSIPVGINKASKVIVRSGWYPQLTINKNNVSITAYAGELPTIAGIKLDNVYNVVVDGFEVTGVNWNALRLGGVYITGGGTNTVKNCISHDNLLYSCNGIKIENSSVNKILNNAVYNNGAVGIRIIGSVLCRDNEIAYNKVFDNTAGGSNADGIGLLENVAYTNVHDNIVFGNGDDGIDLWNTKYSTVTNNVVYEHVLGDGNGFKCGYGGENKITGNTSYGNRYRGFCDNGGGGNYYLNNLSHNNGHCGFESNWRVAGDTRVSTYEGNTAYSNGTNYCFDSRYVKS